MGRAQGRTAAQPGAARRGGAVVLEGGLHTAYTVTPGVIDDNAAAAFTSGQCHAMALALHQRTGWPLRVIEDEEGEPVHCFVEDPDGRAVDIGGVHPDREEFRTAWGEYDEPAEAAALEALPQGFGGWRVPRTAVAASFVDPILAAHAAGQELYAPDQDLDTDDEAELDAFHVVDRSGAEHHLPAGELTAEAREYAAREQSYAVAFYLMKELPGDQWQLAVVRTPSADDDDTEQLAAYAIDQDAGVAVDAHGRHSLDSIGSYEPSPPKYVRNQFNSAGYVATDYGLGERYAALVAAELDGK